MRTLLSALMLCMITQASAAANKQNLIEAIAMMSTMPAEQTPTKRGSSQLPPSSPTPTKVAEGQALASIGRQRIELTVASCSASTPDGGFEVHARQSLGKNGGELWISAGPGSRGSIQLSTERPRRTWISGPTRIEFDGHALNWRGQVTDLDGLRQVLTLQLRCPLRANKSD